MKRPHLKYPRLRRLTATTVLAFLLCLLSIPGLWAQTSGNGDNDEPTDSLCLSISTLSDEETQSFFDGVIPPTPQAAALARYSEYPVGHTTGLPDISIPLYEIRIGGFSLPISISYHNAGARCDEIEGCVGLGWSLLAGGAVTRTVMGAPDLGSTGAYSSNFAYYDIGNVDAAFSSQNSGTINNILAGILDSESDRYSFSAGQCGGVFRYDFRKQEYVVLNPGLSCTIRSYGTAPDTEFRIFSPGENAVYTYSVQERTGVDGRDEGFPATTAWYVSEIDTPYGKVTFEYDDDIPFDIHRWNRSFRSGIFGKPESDGFGSYTEYEFRIQKMESSSTARYYQKLIRRIRWDGNRVEFAYSTSDVGAGKSYCKRLVSMTVISSAGETVKSVTFGNDDPWLARGASRSRRMLRTLSDSQTGIHSFSYHDDIEFPDCTDFAFSSEYSDLWGFWNGEKGKDLTPFLAEWLTYGEDGEQHRNLLEKSRSRLPSLAHTKAGVLHTVTFPTGGSVAYDYEINDYCGLPRGGLRVSKVSVNDGKSVHSTEYIYAEGIDTSQNPEDLMHWISFFRIIPTNGIPHIYRHRTVSTNPITGFTQSNPVAYVCVEERHEDGTRAEYRYNPLNVGMYPTYSDDHPSLFYRAVNDRGNEAPVLSERNVYGTDGELLLTEKIEYAKKDFDPIETGVRLASIYSTFDVYSGNEVNEIYLFLMSPPGQPMPHCATYAYRNLAVPVKTTVTDHATGVSTVTTCVYDTPLYRTLRPVSVSVTNSDGTIITTEYEYPFMRNDAVSREMTSLGIYDIPVATRRYTGTTQVAVSETEFSEHEGFYLPSAYKSWSMPTNDKASERTVSMAERERVTAYNALGRPLGIIVNETDRTDFTWDAYGNLLTSTAPGSLTTTYTHRQLFGLSSISHPNGHKTDFHYNSAGMLANVSEERGVVELYSYSIASHGTAGMSGNGNSVTTRRFLNASGSNSVYSRQYHDGLGRPTVSAMGGANTSGKYLYSSVTYDSRGRESVNTLAAAGGTSIENMTHSAVLSLAKSTYSDNHPYSETLYDGLDRPVIVSTPGDAWHSAGKARKMEYVTNKANSVRLYSAPMTSITLTENGYYAAGTLSGVRTIDEDGNEMTVYTDKLGRKVLERRGPESGKGKNDTYFVNNALGQLRYVLSPEYEKAGYKDKYVYEYRYDRYGNVVKKILPDAGMTQYWYDRAGRMTFMQDETLREKKLHRFFIYDNAGRQVIQGITPSCNRNEAVNFATYGGSGNFGSTGYTLADASRIQSPMIETVSFHDGYGFVSLLDSRLNPSGVSYHNPKGSLTGTVEYCSDGKREMTAMYYDVRGNVIQTRTVTRDSNLRTTTNTYGYADELLTSTTVENGLTTLTKTTYHASSGLPTATDVTVNGTAATVSKLTYDDLGRIKSTARGGKGGTVSYAYDLHGKTTAISAPAFTQNLYYASGLGKALYNGSISAMTWTMGAADPTVRGYRYTYNPYGWLTLAEYGESASLTDHRDRYTERISEFSLNGMPRRLQRHGLKADGHYGKIDNLHIYLEGNRMTGVLEDAEAVTTPGSMDFAGKTDKVSEYGYDSAGRLIKDDSRGIKSVEYDNLGHPVRINFADGNYTRHVYSASGIRLKTVNSTAVMSLTSAEDETLADMDLFDLECGEPDDSMAEDSDDASSSEGTGDGADAIEPGMTGIDTMEYRGNAVWSNGKVVMVLFPGGYATLANGSESGAPTFHYYTTDYLGNVRAVTNGTTGETEQTIAYYPFGSLIATLGTNRNLQPYKFGGKELLTGNGLNEYDFGARSYVPAVPAFTTTDPFCEKYYWLSPYLYCANNPINIMDPNGMELVFTGGNEDDYLYICTLLGNLTKNQYSFNYKIEDKKATISYKLNNEYKSETSDGQTRVNKEVVGIIDDTNITSMIVQNSSEVLIGDINTAAVDLDDIRNMDTTEAFCPESTFLHEVYEQYNLQSTDKEITKSLQLKAHLKAIGLEAVYMNKSFDLNREIDFEKGLIPIRYNNELKQIVFPKVQYIRFDINNNVKKTR